MVHKTLDEDKQTEGQSRMDNPEKLATFGTQDTGRRQTKLRGNQEWTIQRNCATFGTQDTGRRQTN